MTFFYYSFYSLTEKTKQNSQIKIVNDLAISNVAGSKKLYNEYEIIIFSLQKCVIVILLYTNFQFSQIMLKLMFFYGKQ